jgi:NAD(P)-dependent dehydrogenase (short-subunit alcohol dehydrogenase family)
MFDYTGRSVLITGAGQGMGAGIATAMAARGARVLVNDLFADRAVAMAERLGAPAVAVPFDVRDRDAIAAAVERHGPVDVCIHNAGVPADGFPVKRFLDQDPADWDRWMTLNFHGMAGCARAVLPHMLEQGWGRLIFISSEAGRQGMGMGLALYSAAKGGTVAFCRSLALEVARKGITVNSLALGRMSATMSEFDAVQASPVGRLGAPGDVAAACVYLASEEASFVTGQTIPVNGGAFTS